MPSLYDNPKYYEIAFSFRNIPSEVDVLEECFRRFSRIPVKSVLELGCGNCPHMEELVGRGYRYSGLDINERMLEYSRKKASHLSARPSLIQGNMVDFSLPAKVDFVYVLLGSLSVRSNPELMTHFSSVGGVLKEGGLYLLDWCVQYDPPWEAEGEDSWETDTDGIQVKTTVSWKVVNRVEQTFEETIILEINDHGERRSIVGKDVKRAIYPQEFLLLISALEHFEFVGWWNNWDLTQPLEHAARIDRPITLVRRV
jgi:SAM-dependent methyltransferase